MNNKEKDKLVMKATKTLRDILILYKLPAMPMLTKAMVAMYIEGAKDTLDELRDSKQRGGE